jgi:hypothetical protein
MQQENSSPPVTLFTASEKGIISTIMQGTNCAIIAAEAT